MTGVEEQAQSSLPRLMVLLPALWTIGCLLASRGFEIWAIYSNDEAVAENRNRRARNLQDFSRIMPTWLLLIFAVGLVWEAIRLLPTLF